MNSPYLADWNPAKLKGPSQSVNEDATVPADGATDGCHDRP